MMGAREGRGWGLQAAIRLALQALLNAGPKHWLFNGDLKGGGVEEVVRRGLEGKCGGV